MSGLFGCVLGSVLVPVFFVIFGLILWKATPPINNFFGYRSKRSRQSSLAWSFAANRLDTDGKFWALMIIVALQTAVMGYVNFRVEFKLKAAFD